MGTTTVVGAVLLGSALSALAGPAPTGSVYNIDACVARGLAESGEARNALRDEAIALSRKRQTEALVWPDLSMRAGYTRLDEVQSYDFGGGPMALGVVDNYSARAEVSQLLFSSGKVGAAIRAARLAGAFAAAARAETECGLLRRIKRGFYDVIVTRAAVGVEEQSVTQYGALLEQARQKFAAGTASEFDVISARVRVANEEPRLIQARNEAELAFESLRRLLNLQDKPCSFEGNLECRPFALDQAACEAVALACRPGVEMARLRVELRREDAASTKGSALPSLRANASYAGSNVYDPILARDPWEWHWTAGLTAEWKLWDGGMTHALVREKRLELAKEETALEEVRKAVVLDVRQACLGIEHATRALAAAAETGALARKGLEIAQSRYKSGMGTYLEVADATVAASQAMLAALRAGHAYLGALADLQAAVGLKDADFRAIVLRAEGVAK
jgi:HAE1 family hydrophobic/amphiphilic exporter-1